MQLKNNNLHNDLKIHFIKAIEADPQFSEAHLQLALLYQHEENFMDVKNHFNSAIIADIDKLYKLEEKGEELMKKFQFQNAKKQFMKAQKTRNHCAEVYYQQAIYFQKQGHSKEQKHSLIKSIKMNPQKSDYYRDLGILLHQQNQLHNAKSQLEKALNINYADSQTHFTLGKIMCKMKVYRDAKQYFLSALDINPKFTDCKNELADLEFKINSK